MKITVFFMLAGLIILSAHSAAAGEFLLSSPQLEPGGRLHNNQVFSGFGCTGKNISPALYWENAPKGTKSFAITVYDPDAPTGSGWWHWLLFNIPTSVNNLPENAGEPALGLAPQGSVQSRTDFGKPGYGGACPPVGHKPHRYQFTVFALDVDKLDLDANSPGAMVGFYLNQHAIEKAVLTVYYSR
ncbi:MAG TPA: YbhB/YbcL family Raf kinase inhibitor-like protein [Dissulfurispiraceae bacterium]|nr:YbhB/YbcL family Raf kinase inhibitor-like protein [Dissulfurispiraceae bacterium]